MSYTDADEKQVNRDTLQELSFRSDSGCSDSSLDEKLTLSPDLGLSPVPSWSINMSCKNRLSNITPRCKLKLSPDSQNASPNDLTTLNQGLLTELTPKWNQQNCSSSESSIEKLFCKPKKPTRRAKLRDNEENASTRKKSRMKLSDLFHSPEFVKEQEKQWPEDKPVETAKESNLNATASGDVATFEKLSVCDISPKNNYAGSEDDDLIGDFSKPYCLPVERGKYEDLKYITCSTLAHLLAGEHNNITQEYQVVDCRYPYEYAGGHIKGACNAFREEQLTEIFLKNPRDQHNKTVLIFHCEFSSKRAPKLCRRLRNMDRNVNAYPHLYYPELYILNGGYKEFYEQFKSLCEPQGYVSMIDKDFSDQLKQYHRYGNPLGTRRIRKALFKTPSPNKSTKSLSKHKLSKNTENK